ncbi:hypothetical protein BQ8482_280113 [Mesorhizobium delmotii]|uniref:Uncharacterized protein n=1 Tax=Mesorhizobium delmotii TaxID=1631247 RepID=A0A2P9AMM8_9HYPH|nr:hypothetical protein BQ8482_280113 [Mesorhizobium delmotii]
MFRVLTKRGGLLLAAGADPDPPTEERTLGLIRLSDDDANFWVRRLKALRLGDGQPDAIAGIFGRRHAAGSIPAWARAARDGNRNRLAKARHDGRGPMTSDHGC